MKRLIFLLGLAALCCNSHLTLSQKALHNNGLNITSSCQGENCNYIISEHQVHYPDIRNTDWKMENIEIGIKTNGKFLITGDLHIFHKDSAAVLQLEFLFVNGANENVHRYTTKKFEFFNEPDYSEPVFFTSEIPIDVVKEVEIVDVEILHSEIVADFEISSSCYLPCKELALKDAVKSFKKSK